MAKAYVVIKFYDNGEIYEDHYSYEEVKAVSLSYDKAREYIENLPIPEHDYSDYEYTEVDVSMEHGEPMREFISNRDSMYDETITYRIDEVKLV